MEKQILSEEFKRMQKLAGINESDPQSKEYTVDDFILQNIDKKYYQPFFNALFKDKSKEPDWAKITSMSAKELENTYGLSTKDATDIKAEFDKKVKPLNEEEQTTLDSILNKKGNLDHIKNNDQIRLKLIDGEFLRKNPEWKNQLVKFLFYDARQKLVGIELIGKGIYGNAYPKELVIDTQSTNAM
jgi:hypothetical protein